MFMFSKMNRNFNSSDFFDSKRKRSIWLVISVQLKKSDVMGTSQFVDLAAYTSEKTPLTLKGT